MTDHFDFSHALALLKQGKRVARAEWGEWGETKCLEVPNGAILATGIKGSYPWAVTGPDIMAEDWHEVTG